MDPRRVYAEWGDPRPSARLVEVLRAHAYVKGAHVTALEREFAEVAGVRHAVAVDSGTDALFLVLRAWLGVRPRGGGGKADTSPRSPSSPRPARW